MKFKVALFYLGAIAYYNIYVLDKNYYKIRLESYNGTQQPPLLIEFYKEGLICHSNCNDAALIKELTSAIEQKMDLQLAYI